MRVLIARCAVDYSGRLDAHLEPAMRLIMVKADGSVLIHADGGSYKPLNWMSAPCTCEVRPAEGEESAAGIREIWDVRSDRSDDRLVISLYGVTEDFSHPFGPEPGLVKDGVEAHLQELLAGQIHLLGAGVTLLRREYPTPIGPVDIMALDTDGTHLAVEIKRRGEIDGVEQLTRYLEYLNRDSSLQAVRGIFAAREIKPQARVLAEDRGIECLILDYDAMRGFDNPEDRLF